MRCPAFMRREVFWQRSGAPCNSPKVRIFGRGASGCIAGPVRGAAFRPEEDHLLAGGSDCRIVAHAAERIWLLLQAFAGSEQNWTAGTARVAWWPVVRGCGIDGLAVGRRRVCRGGGPR